MLGTKNSGGTHAIVSLVQLSCELSTQVLMLLCWVFECHGQHSGCMPWRSRNRKCSQWFGDLHATLHVLKVVCSDLVGMQQKRMVVPPSHVQ
eukprot:5830383-Amphidinium_carterae.1